MLRKRLSLSKKFFLSSLIAAGFFASTPQVSAATLYWDAVSGIVDGASQGGTGNWGTGTANWDDGISTVVWPGAGNIASFGGTAGVATLNTAVTADGIIFTVGGYNLVTNTTGGLNLTLGTSGISATNTTGTNTISGTGSVTLSGNQSWTQATGGTLAINSSSVVLGANILTFDGAGSVTQGSGSVISGSAALGATAMNVSAGTVTLNGANTFTGDINLSGGTLVFSNLLALGKSTSTANFKTLNLTNNAIFSTTIDFNVNTPTTTTQSAVIFNIGASGGTLDVASTKILLLDDGTTANTLATGAELQGAGTLTKTGAGFLTLGGAATNFSAFTGAIAVSQGTLRVGGAGTFALGTIANGTTISSGAVLDIQGTAATVTAGEPVTINGTGISAGGAMIGNAGTFGGFLTLGSDASIGGANNFSIGTTASTTNNNPIAGAFNLTKVGAGTVTFNNAANTFGGAGKSLFINAGSISLGNNNTNGGNLGNAATTVVIGDAVTGANASLIYNANAKPQTIANPITIASGAGTRSINSTSGAVIFSGPITLANNLSVTNTNGTSTLLSLTGGVGGTGNIDVNSASGLSPTTFSGTALNFTGNFTNIQTVTSGLVTVSANLNNTGNVVQNSATSQLFLSGTNAYTGATTVTNGVLTLSKTAALPAYPTPTSGLVTVSATGTLGLGFGSAGQFAAADVANILSGTLPVTVTAGGAIGLDTFTASTSLSTNLGNFTGGPSSGVALALSKLGVNTLTLTGTNTYTGNTTALAGVLAANEAVGLPATSLLSINAATISGVTAGSYSPINGAFTRTLGNAAGQVQILGGTSGFTAIGSATTINLGGAAASVQWGSANFNPGSLLLNDTAATNTIDFQNAIDLNVAARTVTVNSSTLATAATLSGQLSSVTGGLTKAGAGILNVINVTNNYGGATTVSAGTLSFNGGLGTVGSMPLPSASAVNVNGGTLQILNDTAGTLAYGNVVNLGGTQAITVGNNGVATTGSIVALGQLNAPATATNTATSTTFSSLNNYTTSFAGLALPGGSGNNTTLIANSNVIIAGPVTNRMTTVAVGNFNTLLLQGTATGNVISGVITDATGGSATVGMTTRIQKSGTGTWTFSGANLYTGTTDVTGGTLVLQGSGPGTTVIGGSGQTSATNTGTSINGGTLQINSNVFIGLGNTSTLTTGQGTLNVGNTSAGTLSLQDSSANTLTIRGNNATGATNFLTLGGATSAATIRLDINSGSGLIAGDQIVVAASSAANSGRITVGAGGALIALNQLPSTSLVSGTYNLLTFTAGSTVTSSSFSLSTPAPSGQIYTLQLNNATPALATAEQLVVSLGAGSGNVYWKGNINSVWNTGSGTAATNFTSDYPGTTSSVLPDGSSNVFFTASNSVNTSFATTTLGQALAVNSLNFIGAAPTAANPVGIGGALPLTINATAGFTDQDTITNRATGTGIVVQNLVTATNTISAPLILGGSQQWINAGQGTLSVTGGVTGAFDLAVNNNSTGVTTFATGSVNNAGKVTNSGTGTGTTTITSVIGPNVLGVYQNSTTSNLSIAATNTFTYDGVTKFGLNIQAGTVLAGSNVNEFGGASGRVTLGDQNANSNPSTLTFNVNGTYTIATPIVLAPIANATGTLTIGLATGTSIGLTLSGGVTGNNNLTVNNSTTGTTGAPLFTGLVNNSGTITLTGTNSGTTFATTFSSIGSNVTQITQNSTGFAPLAITALAVNSSGTTLVNSVTGAGTIGLLSVTGGVTGTGPLILNNNSTLANGISLTTTTINQTGTITNSGTGTGTALISAIIGTNVTGVTQNSATSQLVLSGANLFTSGLNVFSGTVTGTTSANAFGANANIITLGAIGGSLPATVQGTALTFPNPIALGTTTGTLTLANSTAAGVTTFSGPITGTNNLTLSTSGAGGITLSNASLNFTGGIVSTGSSTGFTTISSVIGANVNAITQNNTSLSSSLIITGANTAYAGTTTLNSGRIDLQNLAATNVLQAGGTGNIVLNGGVLDLRADGTGSQQVIVTGNGVTGNNIAVNNSATIDVQRRSANANNAYVLNDLSIAAGKTLNVTGATGYLAQFAGTTSVTGAGVVLNPTTASLNLAGPVNDGGFGFTASGTGATRLLNTSTATPSTLTGTVTVNGSTLVGYANAAGSLNTGTNSLGTATISLTGTNPVLNLAPTFNGGLAGTTPGLYEKGYTGIGSLGGTNFMGPSQAVSPTGAFAGYAVPAGGAVITTGLPVTPASTAFLTTTSYQFTGLLNITTAGMYNFSSASDDQANFFIDGNSFINSTAGTNGTGAFYLSAGLHTFTDRVNNNGTNGTVSVQYQGPDTGNTLVNVPNSALSTYSTTAGLSSASATTFGNNIVFAGTSGATINSSSNTTLGSLTMTGAAGTLNFQGSGDQTSIVFTGATTLSDNLTINNPTAHVTLTGTISDGGGNFGLTKTGFGTLTTSGSSTYGGITIINGGTLSTSGLGVGGSPSGVGQSSAAVGNLVFTGNSSLQYTGASQVSDRAFTINAGITATIDVTNSATNLTLPGATGVTTTGILAKTGAGALTLTGADVRTGNTVVNGGTLNITGTLTGNNTSTAIAYGGTAGNTVVNVSNNVTAFIMTGANVAGSNAVYNQTAGTVTLSPPNSDLQYVGKTAGYGYFNLTGGNFNVLGRFDQNSTAGTASTAAYIGNGATLTQTSTEWMILAYSGTAQMTVGPTGTLTRSGATNPFAIMLNTANAYGSLNIAGGTVNTAAQSIRFGNGGSSNTTGFVNLAGGTLSIGTIGTTSVSSGTGNNAYYNFAGGTLLATAALPTGFAPSTTAFITITNTVFGSINNFAATGNTSQNFVGGLTIDTQANAVTLPVANTLLGATGDGIAQSSLTVTPGSGYIGAPVVTFTGGTLVANGTPATGYALINGSGNVTGIVITNPGEYSVAPTLTLTGGGGTGASVAVGSLVTNSNTGGLTKLGSAILSITGAANSFGGPVDIKAGILSVNTLANGSVNSTLGKSSNAASNLLLDGGILQYNGTVAGTTDRSFTLAATAGGLDASGTVAAAVFTLNSTSAMGVAPGLGAATLNLQGSTAGSGSIAALLGDGTGTTVGLTKAGTGTWAIANAANSYTGPTTLTAGTLSVSKLDIGGNVSSIGASSNAAGNLVLRGGTLLFTGTVAGSGTTDRNFTFGNATTAAGGTFDSSGATVPLIISGNMTGANAAAGTQVLTLTSLAASGANALNGNIVDSSGTALTGITKLGVGAWTLGGANNYSGLTTVSAGTLNITGTNAATTGSPITMTTGGAGILNINSSGTVNAGTIAFAGATAGTINLLGGTLQLNNASGITSASSTANTLVFNGGTLKSGTATTIGGSLNINIQAGGGTVDTTGGNITSSSGFSNSASPGTLNVIGGNTLQTQVNATHTGPVNITGSGTTLRLATTAANYTNLWTVGTGANLDINNVGNFSFGGLAGGGTVLNTGANAVRTVTITGTGGITLAAAFNSRALRPRTPQV